MSRTLKRRFAFLLLAIGAFFSIAFVAAGFLNIEYHPGSTSTIALVRGRVEFEWAPNPQIISRLHMHKWDKHPVKSPHFRFDGGLSTGGIYSQFDVPLWVLAAPFIVLAVVILRRTRLKGHCSHCQYDLKGLPSSAPCPECGRTPAPSNSGPP